MRMIVRTAWIAIGVLLLGCDGPSDDALRPEGPPDILAILAEPLPAPDEPEMSALYCRYVGGALDELAPREVDGSPVCPEERSPTICFNVARTRLTAVAAGS